MAEPLEIIVRDIDGQVTVTCNCQEPAEWVEKDGARTCTGCGSQLVIHRGQPVVVLPRRPDTRSRM